MISVYSIKAVSAPRQVGSDRYNPSDHVLRYRAYQVEVLLRKVSIPQPYYHLVFIIAMPSSWSQKKRDKTHGRAHQSKPDKDNLEKALLDSVFNDDAHIWDGRVSKLWGNQDLIILSDVDLPVQQQPFDLQPYYQEAPTY